MTVKDGTHQGLLTGIKTDTLTKWGGTDYSGSATAGTVTPEHLSAWTGNGLPTYLWRGGDASGATELVSGTYNLSDSGVGITKQQYSAALDSQTTVFGTNGYMEAGDTSVCDGGTNSFVGILVVDVIAWTTSDSIISHRDASSPNYGWEHSSQSISGARQDMHYDNSGGLFPRGSNVNHDTGAHVFMYRRDATLEWLGFNSKHGEDWSASANSGLSMSNTGVLRIGLGGTHAAALSMRLGFFAWWEGASAEGWTEADRANIAAKLGITE